MKNVLLLIHDDLGQEARYQAALDVARAVRGHLVCLGLTPIPEFAGDNFGHGGLLAPRERGNEQSNKTRMLARLEAEDVAFEWIDATGFLAQTIEDHAGFADLILLSRDAEGALFPHMADVTGELLVRLGRPMLVVPPDAGALNLYGTAMIAWDGSADAEYALQAAVPLLRHVSRATLYCVDDGSAGLPVEEAARYLSRHGVEPAIEREPAGMDRPGAAILAKAQSGSFDYVVMGAFGRSRALERIFGGATRTMLEQSPIPVFLAHRR